jgi:hypothetical protein
MRPETGPALHPRGRRNASTSSSGTAKRSAPSPALLGPWVNGPRCGGLVPRDAHRQPMPTCSGGSSSLPEQLHFTGVVSRVPSMFSLGHGRRDGQKHLPERLHRRPTRQNETRRPRRKTTRRGYARSQPSSRSMSKRCSRPGRGRGSRSMGRRSVRANAGGSRATTARPSRDLAQTRTRPRGAQGWSCLAIRA